MPTKSTPKQTPRPLTSQHADGSYTIYADGSYSLATAEGHIETFIRPDHQVEQTFDTLEESLVDLDAAIAEQNEVGIALELNRLGRGVSWLRSHVEPKRFAQWRIISRPLNRRERAEVHRIAGRGTTKATTAPKKAGRA